MKEKLTLRNVILWGVALMILIPVFVSFGATARLKGMIPGEGYMSITFSKAIWGITTMSGSYDGEGGVEFIPEGYRAASVPAIIGVILLILASGALVAVSFLIKDEKLKKILSFVIAGVILIAAILFFCLSQVVWAQMGKLMGITAKEAKDFYKTNAPDLKASSGSGVFMGIFSILLAGGIVFSQLVIKDVKFIKSKYKQNW